MTTEQKLTGALAQLQKRALDLYTNNEFQVPRIRFDLKEAIIPSPGPGRLNVLELRIGTSFTYFPEDDGEAMARIERNAYRQMTAFLYEDVIKDLRSILDVIGHGKRQQAMQLVGELYERLRP